MTTTYIPARKYSLTFALLDFWCMLDQKLRLEASQIKTYLTIEQALRRETACEPKSPSYIEPAVTYDDMLEARNEAFGS